MICLTAGTGGTITGIAAKIKERLPKCIVVGIDPHGSILAQPDSLNGDIHSFLVEGIGYDFVPQVLQRRLVDYWVKTDDKVWWRVLTLFCIGITFKLMSSELLNL